MAGINDGMDPLLVGNLDLNRIQTYYAGFEQIFYDHLPNMRKSSLSKGQKLLESEHIVNLKEVRKPGKLTEITGHCIRQAAVTQEAYKVELKLNDERKVVLGQYKCWCPYGEEGLCKHFPAFLLHINQERDEPSTDQPCGFIEPTQAGKLKYPKGMY